MSFLGGLFKGLAGLVLGALALGLLSVTAGPAASFTMTPAGNPVVGQAVQFTDTSTGGPTTWFWTFGDGQTSSQQSPIHVYTTAGPFNVALTVSNTDGFTQQAQSLMVSPKDTLRLNAGHPFTVTLTTTNQHDNNISSAGQAIPQSDVFGFFSLPGATSDPNNPEVFVKLLDGRAINGEFWVFYGHMTDLIYDLTVTEISTGLTKTYHKDAGNSAGGFDTSGFHPSPTPTQTPTITQTPTPGPPTQTPTPTPTGGASLIVVNLVASNGAWNFDGGGPEFTMHVGQSYQLQITRADPDHQFTGLQKTTDFSSMGCGGSNFPSQPIKICNMTPSAANVGTYAFGCSQSTCTGHDNMQNGRIFVVP